MSTTPPAAAVAETHTSIVTFIGDRAYKLKKAVDLGFLDFRTREARRMACHAEVELNRRIAPDVYLGVLDVSDAEGVLCDHLVLMRRMPAERRLSTLIRAAPAGTDVAAALVEVARTVAEFHARCATSTAIQHAGSPATLRGLWHEGLDELAKHPGVIDPAVVAELGALAMRYLDGRGPLFADRQRHGMVRDGHGDLQAGDIFCLDDGPRILDCLEFDERLRFGDVLADVAFLAMDLERLGAAQHAAAFLDAYAGFSGEHHPRSLQDLCVAYRAFVRCKVACLRSAQGDPDAADEARLLAALAVRHLRTASVRLVLVGGLPGTGKSTVAAGLAATRDGWLLLRSDELRAAQGDRYSPAARDNVYDSLLACAEDALVHGRSVILDASWSGTGWRRSAADLADRTSAAHVEIVCTVPRPVAVARIAARRAAGNDPSEATVEVRDAMADTMPAWPRAIALATDADPATVLAGAGRLVDAVDGARRG